MAVTTIDADHSGTQSLRRVLHHYVRSSRRQLQTSAPSDAAVHEARKAIKKSRAALRLLRPALGQACYRRENRILRNSAHRLNALRDARVLIQALATLRQQHAPLRDNRAAARLATRLQRELAEAREGLGERTLRAECHTLQRLERRARELRVGRAGWSVLGPALRRIYRQGRRRLPGAAEHPPDPALHEWRKQIKYLRYALRILRPMQPGLLGALEKQAGAIAEQLGVAHDLALLQQQARQLGGEADAGLRELLQEIEQLRVRRAREALVRGEQLFQPRPREFEHLLQQAWRRWRRRQH